MRGGGGGGRFRGARESEIRVLYPVCAGFLFSFFFNLQMIFSLYDGEPVGQERPTKKKKKKKNSSVFHAKVFVARIIFCTRFRLAFAFIAIHPARPLTKLSKNILYYHFLMIDNVSDVGGYGSWGSVFRFVPKLCVVALGLLFVFFFWYSPVALVLISSHGCLLFTGVRQAD
jgi:hypothetical protein